MIYKIDIKKCNIYIILFLSIYLLFISLLYGSVLISTILIRILHLNKLYKFNHKFSILKINLTPMKNYDIICSYLS